MNRDPAYPAGHGWTFPHSHATGYVCWLMGKLRKADTANLPQLVVWSVDAW